MTKINVLHIFMNLQVGGAQEIFLTQLKYIDRTKFHIIVCCLNGRGSLVSEVEKLGNRVICLNRLNRRNDIQAIFELLKLIRQNNIDIVHTYLYSRTSFYGHIAALMARTPVIIAAEMGSPSKKSLKKRISDRLLARFTDQIIALSEATRSSAAKELGVGLNKITVIYPGVDIGKFTIRETKREVRNALNLPHDVPIIGIVARLDPVKGHEYLLDAMLRVWNFIASAKLMIVGAGPLEESLRSRVERLGLSKQVMFMGMRRDIPQLLKAMDIFVLPSLQEGFGMALLEAMVMGLPVIATNVGGIPEVVDDGKTGILVPPRDPDALSEMILVLLKDEKQRHRMGMLGKEKALSQFTAQHSVAQLQALYESLLQIKGIGVPTSILPRLWRHSA